MRSSVLTASVLVALSVLAPFERAALAQAPSERVPLVPTAAAAPDAAPVTTERRYYRAQSLGVDLAAVAMMTLAVNFESDVLGQAGVITYMLGTPTVHLVHGHPGRAVGSVAMRVGVPLFTAVAAAGSADSCEGDGCGFESIGHAAVGALVGATVVVLLDDVIFSYDDVPIAPRTPTWNVGAAPTNGGLTLGLSGTF